MWKPDASMLRGLSYEVAECYGKPHVGCRYRGQGVGSHVLNSGATCAICHAKASNAHHQPPRSKCSFTLATPKGTWLLKPALFAVCGSGTTGCHDGFHGGAWLKPRWVWLTDEYARMWWEGELLSGGYEPHDQRLYDLGYWVVRNSKWGGDATFKSGMTEVYLW